MMSRERVSFFQPLIFAIHSSFRWAGTIGVRASRVSRRSATMGTSARTFLCISEASSSTWIFFDRCA